MLLKLGILLSEFTTRRCCSRRKLFSSIRKCSVASTKGACLNENLNSSNEYTSRTHNCGELRPHHLNTVVNLFGWLHHIRLDKFLILRDSYGVIQIYVEEELFQTIQSVSLESVLNVVGIVKLRPPGQENQKIPTGSVEVVARKVEVISEAKKDLPFHITHYNKAKEKLLMEYRYLGLRFSNLQYNLRLRSKLLMAMRQFLIDRRQFVDVETPTLFVKTPGGAQEFIVPTQHAGKFYSLVQSPQQFKQMLMVGGIDRYFQIARCYRDESTTADRQPEFTQLDLEISFTTQENVLRLIEDLLNFVWPSHLPKIPKKFPIMTFEQAMSNYGTDKPDLRFSVKIQDVTEILRCSTNALFSEAYDDDFITMAICIPRGKILKLGKKKDFGSPNLKRPIIVDVESDGGLSSKFVSRFGEDTCKMLLSKLNYRANDTLVMQTGLRDEVLCFLGRLRVQCANDLQEKGENLFDDKDFQFLWVVDFPLFVKNETGNWESAHHPFTAPIPSHLDLVYSDPGKVTAQHYDLVLNGSEIGGGSIRIHDFDLQRYILDNVLRIDPSQMNHFIQALRVGCPPHGGIALGIDRLVSIMCGCKSIRDVIAFPKGMHGKDPLSGAPSPVSQEELALYHLLVNERFK